MSLPIELPLPPMEAHTASELPAGDGWQYEPKWDGFRCLVFRDGTDVRLQSKSCKPLGRYFPDTVEAIGSLRARKFALDGELVIPIDGSLSFEQLQLRLHPAESRVRTLVAQHRAMFIAFDLLVDGGNALIQRPLRVRRERLERFAERYFDGEALLLSPATTDPALATDWLRGRLGGLDGVVAKRLDARYAVGERTDAMLKIKRLRTADCVVGGFRWAARGRSVASLLLGLYDRAGVLHHVGFTSAFSADDRRELVGRLEPLMGGEGFGGAAPGAPSRWSPEGREWEPLEPRLVVEVRYDHFTGGRFRHGTGFVRWRPDKAPRQCTLEQVERDARSSLALFE